MTEFHNHTIQSLGLITPAGCMGEGAEFEIEMQRSGSFEYRGTSNVEHLGRHRGAVNCYAFDNLAAVIQTSGFMQLSSAGCPVSTVGIFQITVADAAERITFTRDALDMPPVFWAVLQLLLMMVEKAKWGEEAFQTANESFPARLDGTFGVVIGDGMKRDGYF